MVNKLKQHEKQYVHVKHSAFESLAGFCVFLVLCSIGVYMIYYSENTYDALAYYDSHPHDLTKPQPSGNLFVEANDSEVPTERLPDPNWTHYFFTILIGLAGGILCIAAIPIGIVAGGGEFNV